MRILRTLKKRGGSHKAERAVQLRTRLGSRLCRDMAGRVPGAFRYENTTRLPESLQIYYALHKFGIFLDIELRTHARVKKRSEETF